MAVLYRKYRPGKFSEVVNQKYIIATLKNQVENGQLAHAYLFTGSRGVGKTSVARILAKAVNCTGTSKKHAGDACGECDSCKQIDQGIFLDLVEIDAASNTGVDNIRDLIEHVKFSPSVGKYKVFIIDEVHMLSKGAFNALLKTLEEPPTHVIFILATTEINKVPATIISRTQRFDFKALSESDIEKHLLDILKAEKLKLNPEAVKLVARNAGGSVRDSLSLLGKVMTLGGDASLSDYQQLLGVTDVQWCERLTGLVAKGAAGDIPKFFDELLQHGNDPVLFNRDYLEFLRALLVQKISGTDEEHKPAGEFSLADLIFIIRLFLRSYKDIASSPSPDIPLLLAAIEAAMRKQSAPAVEKPTAPAAAVKEQPAAYQTKTAAEPTVATATVSDADSSITITEAEINQHWNEVVNHLKKINGPLANLVKNSPIISVRNGKIVLGVKYTFHRENLESQKNLTIIRQVLRDVYQKPVGLNAEIIRETAEAKPTAVEALTDALQIFGGEVIE